MPGCLSSSEAAPAPRKVRMVVTFGTLGSGASTTTRPLLSFFSVNFGRFSGLVGPGGGGVFCWASTGETPASAIVATRTKKIIIDLLFLIFARLLRLGFRYSIDHCAIICNKVLLRCHLHLFRSDLLKRSQQRVDLIW